MRGKLTRGRLLDAAYRILLEDSLSQLSVERVSARAGLSRRTFFLHFTSKDELMADVLAHVRPAFAADYKAWSDALADDLTAEQRIEALFRHLVSAVSEPGWKGACFLRISAEFGDRPGHPAHAVVAESHRDLERWLTNSSAATLPTRLAWRGNCRCWPTVFSSCNWFTGTPFMARPRCQCCVTCWHPGGVRSPSETLAARRPEVFPLCHAIVDRQIYTCCNLM